MQALLKKLHSFNIKVDFVGEKLSIQSPKGVMTEDLLTEIKLHKDELLAFLMLYKTKKEDRVFIPQTPEQSDYVLSSSQRRLWLLSQFEGGNIAYNIPSVFELNGHVFISSLEKAFLTLIERHESLRTLFRIDKIGEVRQVISPYAEIKFQLQYEDISSEPMKGDDIKIIIQKEIEFDFDLSVGSLLRAKIIKTSGDTYVFICVMHHIISDAWSAEVMTNELFALYDSFANGNTSPLPALGLQYKDYAVWQQDQLKNNKIENHKHYWLRQFEGELPILDLPVFQARPVIKSYTGKSARKLFSPALLKELKVLCQSQDSTLFMGLLATVKVLLYRYTNQNDIIIGSPIAGREQEELQNQIGFYANTIALRTRFEGNHSFKELLGKVKEVTLGAYEYQSYPFDELVKELPLKRDLGRNPLFDVMVTLQNTNNLKVDVQTLGKVSIKKYETGADVFSKFDMEFIFEEEDKGLNLVWVYNRDIYTKEFAERGLNHLEMLLHSIVVNPEGPINSLNYLSEEEEHQLLTKFNDTKVDYPKDKTIVDLFEAQVTKTPTNIAVVFEKKELTYQELNEQANQLGNYLRTTYTVEPGDLIAVKLERSEKMIIAVLGILKSGGAYVPIDTGYPQQRITYIENDSKAKIVIDQKEFEAFLQGQQKYSKENPEKINSPQDLAYIIYTSGTTGNPKGVMIKNSSTVELINWSCKEFDSARFDVLYAATSYCFDLSAYEMFYPLSKGKKIRILKNALEIKNYINDEQRILINTVPSVVKRILEEGTSLENVTVLNMAGESIPLDIVDKLPLDNIKVYNLYGPSEDTTYSTFFQIEKTELLSIPIGKPISNTQVYILDEVHNLLPVGVSGKIYVSGAGLAIGYLNKPELSAEKFIPNPFTGGRMYNTDDLGCWLENGNIRFLGRKDQQVKIRGYRIELGEIENALSKYSNDIQQVVVETKEINEEKTLVAYYVSKMPLDKSSMRNYLLEKLPDYMVPVFYVDLEILPLTPNGKIDRKSLPGVTNDDVIKKQYVAPATEIEHILVETWQELLKIEKIGTTDNFFELGGHSLNVTQLIREINAKTDLDLGMTDIFRNQTIKEILQNTTTEKNKSTPFKKAALQDSYAVTNNQKGIWLGSKMNENSAYYHIKAIKELKKSIDVDILNKVFNIVIDKHESLRTIFKESGDGELRQHILSKDVFHFKFINLDCTTEKLDIQLFENYLNQSQFDLKELLIKVYIVNFSSDRRAIGILVHHIIFDGWSMNVLINEIIKYYSDLVNNESIVIDPLPVQYKDYAEWMKAADFSKQKSYWASKLKGELPVLEMPSPKRRPLLRTHTGETIRINFNDAFSIKLKNFAKSERSTLFVLLVTGIKSILYRYTNQNDIIIGTPIAGRNHPHLDSQLGLYLNTLIIRNYISGNKSFIEFFSQVKESLLEAYENQNYEFESLLRDLKINNKDMSRSLLFDIMVTYQNFTNEEYKRNALLENNELFEGHQMSEVRNSSAQYDLIFRFFDHNNALSLSVEYNSDIYDSKFVSLLATHFENFLTIALGDPSIKIEEIDFISSEERSKIFDEFNSTTLEYPKNKSYVDLFKESVNKYQQRTALKYYNIEVSYAELDNLSNQFANHLESRCKFKPEDLILIEIEKSHLLIIALIGIIKTGAAYVPIDPDYPKEHIDKLKGLVTYKFIIDNEFMDAFVNEIGVLEKNYKSPKIKPSDLFHVMFTSGSTGIPKGVMLEHKNIVKYVSTHSFFYINEKTVLLSTVSPSFDTTNMEFWTVLFKGGKLVIADKDDLFDYKIMESLIKGNKVNTMWLTASWFQQVLDCNIQIFSSIEQFISGGDIVSAKHMNLLQKEFPTIKLYNGYGPTENTTFSSVFQIDRQYENALPIGKPIDNSQVHILNNFLVPQPIGIIGEIYVSGDGLARGYYNDEKKTAELFLEQTVSKKVTRLYKTGDYGKWLADGTIEFLGRKDNLVKIRGYRIELSEVEKAVYQFSDSIAEVVVAVRKMNEHKILVAFYVADLEIDLKRIREYLVKRLPNYMVPQYFAKLDSLPLSPNGKINRKKLLEIDLNETVSDHVIAPSTEIEKRILDLWTFYLKVEKIGILNDFFELGGDSLVAMKLINELQEIYNVKISVKEFYLASTVSNLSNLIDSKEKIFQSIPKAEIKEFYELSFAQRRMWLLSQNDSVSISYNSPFVLNLNITAELLIGCIVELIKKYEILRTIFPSIKGIPKQKICNIPDIDFDGIFKIYDDNNEFDKIIRKELNTSFNLKNELLLKVRILNKGDKCVCFVNMHHIIIDGESYKILLQELNLLINERVIPNTIKRFEYILKTQYKDFSEWENASFASGLFDKKISFWKSFYKGFRQSPIKTDYPRISNSKFGGETITFDISPELNTKIDVLLKNKKVTFFTFLYSIVSWVLCHRDNRKSIVIGTLDSNRDYPDLKNQIGFFANTIPIQINVENNFDEFLMDCKKTIIDCFDNKEIPFDLIVSEIRPDRNGSRLPFFDVMLIVQDELIAGTESNNVEGNYFDKPYSKTDIIFEFISKTKCQVHYDNLLFKTETINGIIESISDFLYQKLLTTNKHIDMNKINSANQKSEISISEIQIGVHRIIIEKTPNKIIGLNDHFFEAGGSSLDLLSIIISLSNEFNIDIDISEIIENLTITNISQIIYNKINP